MGLLSSLHLFPSNMLQTEIAGEIPIVNIIKFLLCHFYEMKEQQAVSSYMNAIRIALQRE